MNLIARNIAYLYVIQFLRLCLPLALLSVLTRVLSEVQYSVYLYTLASSAWLSIFVEYGFNVSATRRIAALSDPAGNRTVVTETQSAKWMLAGLSLIFFVWALTQSSVFSPYPEWAVCAWLLGVMMGMTPTYYFQALSRLRIVAVLEVTGGLLTFAFVLLLIRRTEDFSLLVAPLIGVRFLIWQVLERQMVVSEKVRYRDIFTVRPGVAALKDGWRIFLVQGAASLYTSFNVVLLGGVSTAYAVAVYGSCERLVRAGLTFIAQATSAIFPRLNALKTTSPDKLGRARGWALAAFFIVATASLPVVYLMAPLVSRVLFHDKLPDIVHVLRIMSLVIPAIAVSNVLAMHFLVVDRKEHVLNLVVFSAVPISLIAGYFLSIQYGAAGMASAWVAIEWTISICLAAIIFYRTKPSKQDR
ncbi:lipopolysaccharide biosynthesis protein [Pandoraea sp. PE-S2R-1]|uniref:lipopolysaccharide biosynthesis protein n=1 Tax=Pandoraea sp. PE-S2R-1 TaxID=1986994 RepID=UPI000B401740|nr:oligosaccharide flippase family protein [Pandoraea sp. PE-S2R-1]